MAGTTVSGMKLGLASGAPSSLTSASTDAEKVTAYSGLTYTYPASCLITSLPKFEEFWETKEDTPTVCDNTDEIVSGYKTNQKVSDSSFSAIFEKGDPIIILANELRVSRNDVGVIEITHANGTDKIWAEIEIKKTDEDPTETDGKVKFMAEFFFKKKPVRN